jgi:hypothetical protein
MAALRKTTNTTSISALPKTTTSKELTPFLNILNTGGCQSQAVIAIALPSTTLMTDAMHTSKDRRPTRTVTRLPYSEIASPVPLQPFQMELNRRLEIQFDASNKKMLLPPPGLLFPASHYPQIIPHHKTMHIVTRTSGTTILRRA